MHALRVLLLGLFLLVGGCGGGGGGGGGESAGGGGGGGSGGGGSPTLPAGPVAYNGPYANPQAISYTDSNGQSQTIDAVPGQAVVMFEAPVPSEATATALFAANGGTILGKIPAAGFYLVSVTAGSEATFIAAMNANASVKLAAPNGTLAPKSTAFIDACLSANGHGAQVQAAYLNNGGTGGTCIDAANAAQQRVLWDRAAYHIISEGSASSNDADYLNISAGGNSIPEYIQVWRYLASAVHQIPEEFRENLVITVAAGNENLNMATVLAAVRSDPVMAGILERHFLIVRSNITGGAGSNFVTGADRSLATINNPEAASGTSLAAPAALGRIQAAALATGLPAATILRTLKDVVAATGAFVDEACLAIKLAKQTNANGNLVTAEAIDKARAIVASRNDPAGALNVTNIAFTSLGPTTAAVITPAISGVTVQYTVSGTDGYYDSGSLTTNGTGRVSFGIPAGASGVRDTISVTAVRSGVTRTSQFTW